MNSGRYNAHWNQVFKEEERLNRLREKLAAKGYTITQMDQETRILMEDEELQDIIVGKCLADPQYLQSLVARNKELIQQHANLDPVSKDIVKARIAVQLKLIRRAMQQRDTQKVIEELRRSSESDKHALSDDIMQIMKMPCDAIDAEGDENLGELDMSEEQPTGMGSPDPEHAGKGEGKGEDDDAESDTSVQAGDEALATYGDATEKKEPEKMKFLPAIRVEEPLEKRVMLVEPATGMGEAEPCPVFGGGEAGTCSGVFIKSPSTGTTGTRRHLLYLVFKLIGITFNRLFNENRPVVALTGDTVEELKMKLQVLSSEQCLVEKISLCYGGGIMQDDMRLSHYFGDTGPEDFVIEMTVKDHAVLTKGDDSSQGGGSDDEDEGEDNEGDDDKGDDDEGCR